MQGPITFDLRNIPDRPKDFMSSEEDTSFIKKHIARLEAEGRKPFFILALEKTEARPQQTVEDAPPDVGLRETLARATRYLLMLQRRGQFVAVEERLEDLFRALHSTLTTDNVTREIESWVPANQKPDW